MKSSLSLPLILNPVDDTTASWPLWGLYIELPKFTVYDELVLRVGVIFLDIWIVVTFEVIALSVSSICPIKSENLNCELNCSKVSAL